MLRAKDREELVSHQGRRVITPPTLGDETQGGHSEEQRGYFTAAAGPAGDHSPPQESPQRPAGRASGKGCPEWGHGVCTELARLASWPSCFPSSAGRGLGAGWGPPRYPAGFCEGPWGQGLVSPRPGKVSTNNNSRSKMSSRSPSSFGKRN